MLVAERLFWGFVGFSFVAMSTTDAGNPNNPEWWLSGREGTLSRHSQYLVRAFVEVNKILKLELEDGWIAGRVQKVGGGNPSKQAIRKLRMQIEEDKKWCRE